MITKYEELIDLQNQLFSELKKVASKQNRAKIDLLTSQVNKIKEAGSHDHGFTLYPMDELVEMHLDCTKNLAILQPGAKQPKKGDVAWHDAIMDTFHWYVIAYEIEKRLGENNR